MSDKKPTKLKQCRMMNSQCDVEAILIAILNQYVNLTIAKPQRKTTVTKQFIKIVKIDFCSGDEVEVQTFIRKREDELITSLTKQGVSQQTAKRRMQEAKRWELLHLLMDLVTEYGYTVYAENEQNCGFDGEVTISYRNKLLYSIKDINRKAPSIRDYIMNKVNTQMVSLITRDELKNFL
ncbi:hypothetical protein EHI8A_002900 [Entamoeba histolytica HM-1:IMSS-B]|uniref:Uncharacterized protein n=6 Tax=Entamoeba histolytica TaxID=5759 RepID=C4LUN9_ENTH1|nr:hypothetical protein EHI_023280 [Entamoeba histolytica HM-1:IMSS]EMD45466.1 ORF 0.75, putative [Entamoeba histolytica KU27]EMH74428.1 hypothetical protein EHI8A_002900 [Entamoeba histolytica HM-1:IMSS-B]EMS14759.1 hypothetical protein KM1_006380 [Entamoeba histolytica HM-3:IMSS]ENY59867.1 hypothetical protein EHI7A_004570 [Entamoeba histolytica HM-1:IMSS-A]GAT92339.1 hypothetical protein CL6EHI_023280 [Entamoeba histolytica]|eukprot:XP_655644.1 hypothetical protein EHI_023280 [Entamoeba histolytica HM-1:IMSS]